MKVFITGASGAMGHFLARYISENISRVEIFGLGRTRLSKNTELYIKKYHRCDLHWELKTQLAETISSADPEIVFHLAGVADVGKSFREPDYFVVNNISGTVNLFESIAASRKKPVVVICSTSEVYGNIKSLHPVDESWPMSPCNPYAVTKVTQEYLAGYYNQCYGIPYVITRAFGYINPLRQDLVATSIARQIVSFENGETDLIRHGNLGVIRTFCDARDIAEAYWLAAMKGKSGEAYNIGTDKSIQIGDLLVRLCAKEKYSERLFKAVDRLQEDKSLCRPTDVTHSVPNITKFKQATNWQPKRSLDESLDWLMSYIRGEQE